MGGSMAWMGVPPHFILLRLDFETMSVGVLACFFLQVGEEWDVDTYQLQWNKNESPPYEHL
jgi:hypothetical protein